MAKRPQKPKKVVIVGSASNTKDQTPWDDESFEIWGLAWRLDFVRVDRLFDVHPVAGVKFEERLKKGRVKKDYPEFLASRAPLPLYLQDAYSHIPSSIKYPMEEVLEFMAAFDPAFADPDYFASSIAFMFALAMCEGFEEIRFFGVDLTDEEEYGHQKPNLEYMIGLARGSGIKVFIPERSALCKFPYRYGYEDFTGDEGILTVKALQDRVKMYSEKHQAALAEAYTADGARQECQQLLSILKNSKRGKQV